MFLLSKPFDESSGGQLKRRRGCFNFFFLCVKVSSGGFYLHLSFQLFDVLDQIADVFLQLGAE